MALGSGPLWLYVWRQLGDLLAVAASWLALWKEKTGQKWMFAAILIGIVVKRYASVFEPSLESIRFFDPSAFHREFFNHFGPKDFMGIPLQGAWWILICYAVLILVCNIGGEELWWRGYVLPRQELAFGGTAWVLHGISWSVWYFLVGLPSVHATKSVGHHSYGNLRCRAFLCCTTHKKHMAGHRWAQFRQSALLCELG
jgi:membrane protease YdiL (CAAX protease family)